MILYLASVWGCTCQSSSETYFCEIQIIETHTAIIKFKGMKCINCIEKWTYISHLFKFSKLNLKNAIWTLKPAELDFYVEQHYNTLKCSLGYTTVFIKWCPAKATPIKEVHFTYYEGHYRKLQACRKAAQRCHLAVTLRNFVIYNSSFFQDTALKCRRKENFIFRVLSLYLAICWICTHPAGNKTLLKYIVINNYIYCIFLCKYREQLESN